jgi:hypothetical protein
MSTGIVSGFSDVIGTTDRSGDSFAGAITASAGRGCGRLTKCFMARFLSFTIESFRSTALKRSMGDGERFDQLRRNTGCQSIAND